ncbi:MAG: Fe2+-dependent dioxygenase, partial [Caldimonas sp.]
MLLHIREVLNADELRSARSTLADAPWGDGRRTAGVQSAIAKRNEQLPQDCAETRALQPLVMAALNRHHGFFSAALPKRVFPPLFNRYAGAANSFGNHVDNAVRFIPGGQGERVRTDISCTLFLADPADYDGGELKVEDTFGAQSVKL